MKVGYAKRDVTPPMGLRLGGYAHRFSRPSQVVHDPLMVSAIHIASHGEDALLIHCDVLGVYRSFADNIKRVLQEKVGIGSNRIFLTTTHTHSGPETITPMWPNTFPYSSKEKKAFKQWEDFLRESIIEAATEAYEKSTPASLRLGETQVQGLTYNRAYKNNVVDERMPFMLIRNRDFNIVLTNYCCHPVCNTDLGVSADYPGELYARMIRNGFEVFFTTGSAGNIDPIEKGREFISKMGLSLQHELMNAMGNTVELAHEGINVQNRLVRLKLRGLPPLEESRRKFQAQYELCRSRLDNQECVTSLLYADEEYEVAKEGKKSVETMIQTLTIGGEVVFISIPGELFVEFGLGIREKANSVGYKSAMVSTYSEDYIGYIPDKAAFEKVTYEARLARWSRVTPEAGDHVFQTVLDCIISSRKNQ
ncbi:MAG: neutral/alkaline non-lysosomal ceramidase N-terminal domain-containing protein [Candidatus Brockarchaeota archaeon]|nr:neutral/alkaline non-lysosomal ceramidase N-terminal domain-containing protein [Candidatus Brockarchaeota archaeon]MBO3809389.1 neutral/alkaline non-lysosomal ceramidase N-terminal domain-containing protein [Candidatus Brockarchaeota archaeon]